MIGIGGCAAMAGRCGQWTGLQGRYLDKLLQRHACNWWSDIGCLVVFIGLLLQYVTKVLKIFSLLLFPLFKQIVFFLLVVLVH
jgi:hypothetical protein